MRILNACVHIYAQFGCRFADNVLYMIVKHFANPWCVECTFLIVWCFATIHALRVCDFFVRGSWVVCGLIMNHSPRILHPIVMCVLCFLYNMFVAAIKVERTDLGMHYFDLTDGTFAFWWNGVWFLKNFLKWRVHTDTIAYVAGELWMVVLYVCGV